MIPELDIRAKQEEAHYKAVTTRSRFLQQIFLGLGGATVFGFVGALTRELIAPAAAAINAGALVSAPIVGLAAIGVLGIACLYVGAKFLSNTILMEQDYSAKKIAMATGRGRAPVQAPTVETEHTKPAAPPISVGVSEVASHAPVPSSQVHDVASHQMLEVASRVRA